MRSDSRRFRLVLFALVAGAAAVVVPAAQANDKPSQKVKVFAFAQKDASGFIDERTQELGATVKDIQEVIVKKKNGLVQLVEAEEQADIVLEITERQLVERQGQLSTNTTYSKDGKHASSTTTRTKEHDVVLKAVMRVGDYRNELTGQCDLGYLFGGAYRQAAKNLVGSLESWVKNNHSRLQVK
jgi:type II secretory pathway pseudopilin PulG